ncbi:hypothetical protein [Lyngbya aestuarii]|nr:hypothetical protein [Lyngbya aestuarii]
MAPRAVMLAHQSYKSTFRGCLSIPIFAIADFDSRILRVFLVRILYQSWKDK